MTFGDPFEDSAVACGSGLGVDGAACRVRVKEGIEFRV
jgi:hypothetical protein